jgi:hypothetical protein
MSPTYRELPCSLCRVLTRTEFLVVPPVETFPHGLVCEACAAELLAEEDDAHAGESECSCRSHCPSCTPGC